MKREKYNTLTLSNGDKIIFRYKRTLVENPCKVCPFDKKCENIIVDEEINMKLVTACNKVSIINYSGIISNDDKYYYDYFPTLKYRENKRKKEGKA